MVVVMCSMAGVLMQALDTTIANVALPNMMGDMSASREQITWVLTSYIVAAAVMTAPVGWVAARFGKKNILIVSMVGFTVTSMLCGAAQGLTEMVVFRLLQGVFGAALAPLSQSVMLDLYPPEKRGQIMAIWGMGIMLGPILGPTLGGYLTDTYSWRWVFYVNVPFGLAATVGLWLFFKDTVRNAALRFDFFGFAVMALGVGALQLMLDRGTTKDWFSSTEIVLECTVAALGFYLFAVHMFTAKSTFIQRGIFADRNFVTAQLVMFMVGAMLLASTALMPPYLQTLGGHTVTEAGLLLGPRGLGTMVAMVLVGRVSNHIDPRLLMTVGTAAVAWSLWDMSGWTPSIDDSRLLFTTIVQGFGVGMVFVPLNLVAFATLPGQYRTDGTAVMNLVRNVGSAIGISVTTTLLSNSMQAIHSQLTAFATPFNRAFAINAPSMLYNLGLPSGRAMLDGAIQIRAAIEAYANDFLFMFYVSLITFPIIWLLRRPAYSSSGYANGNGQKKAEGAE
ncbi:MAG: DHA2 family efflux MFS transporter permease subunit [Alphaproteobacteria bacterium]|nr:DHA2 family efflux MFS transporter permease subunit [Alphaproteobacteria bacterium]MDE2630970.1 DHA2 family efflux MFS transporter permease subunit [Alphaproteobacteria bacterium]